jgi:hypothetical protein
MAQIGQAKIFFIFITHIHFSQDVLELYLVRGFYQRNVKPRVLGGGPHCLESLLPFLPQPLPGNANLHQQSAHQVVGAGGAKVGTLYFFP